ncbi:type II secretion system protein GspD [Candidatus Poribacteria bacterium]|nr:type II secretion system protein GspD [Candidatus Poribacteria bacterium]
MKQMINLSQRYIYRIFSWFLCSIVFILFLSITGGSVLAQEDGLISMSFRDAEIDYVLDFFSRATGYTVVKDAEIKDRITIIGEKDLTTDQAISVLNSILAVKGYTTVINDKVIKIVKLDSAKQENIQINVGSDPDNINSSDTIVTQIMPLSNTNAAQIVKELNVLMPEYGVMVAHTQSNTLIIIASSSKIKKFAQIVKELDIPVSDMIKVEVFPIQYREAEALADVIEDIFDRPTGTSASEQAERERNAMLQRFRGRVPGGFGPPGSEQQEQQTSTDSEILQVRSNVTVVADEDTNSIVVSASQSNIALIGELIKKLDKEITGRPETRIFALENADAVEVSDELDEVFESSSSSSNQNRFGFGRFGRGPQAPQTQGGQSGEGILGLPEINVVADERTNSVIVTTTTEQMDNIGLLISQLDKDISDFEETTEVIQLENAEADQLADVLNELFETSTFEQSRGRTTTRARGGVMGTAAETIETARGLSGNVKVVAEDTTNSLMITTYKRNLDKVKEIIKALDIMLPQVLIEVKIVEVSLDDESKFGVEWMWEHTTTSKGKSYNKTGVTGFGLADEVYGLKYGIVGKTIEGMLMALEKNTNVNILSTPRILTLDNHEAVINISQEVPYLESTQETQTGGVLTSYNYKDVGVILTVTPRINKSETVSLDVEQEINSLIEFTLFDAPVIAKREASASVTVKDGQSMIIGGIIEDNKTTTINKVPILGSIPFIGKLFQREEANIEKTELMVFITPHIIRDTEEAEKITREQKSIINLPRKKG